MYIASKQRDAICIASLCKGVTSSEVGLYQQALQ